MADRKDNSPKPDNWVDFTGDIFSVSMCGDQSAVIDNEINNNDAENQYGQLYQHQPNSSARINDNPYLPNAYNTCDESDYGEIVVNQHELDAVSTVTPATFAMKEPGIMDFSRYNWGNGYMNANVPNLNASPDDSNGKKRRKLLIGGIVLVALMLAAVIVTVPLVVMKPRAVESAQISNAEEGLADFNEKTPVVETESGTELEESKNQVDTNQVDEDATNNGSGPVLSDDVDSDKESAVDPELNMSKEDAQANQEDEVIEPTFQSPQTQNKDEVPQDSASTESSSPGNIISNSDETGEIETYVEPTSQSLQPDPQPSAATENSLSASESNNDETGEIEMKPNSSTSTQVISNEPYEPTNSDEAASRPQPIIESTPVPVSSPSASSGGYGSSISAPATSNINPAAAPTPSNSNLSQSSITTTVEETGETPAPTYIWVTPAPQLPTLEPTQFTESVVRISLQTDKQGYETSWTLESIHYNEARSTNYSTVIAAVDENTYDSYQEDSKEFTLPRGAYRFTLKDAFGDGFCCRDFQGYYAVTIDGREVIKGGYYQSEVTYDFQIGYFPEMTAREKEWLVAHNVRRKTWHEGHGVSYVPLRWSAALAEQAQSWADKLTEACEVVGIDHEKNVVEGENLAKNQADGRKGMGQLYPPDNILKRWVDYEADLPNPYNLHLTQALWRASKYVGCADALREDEDGSVCRIQVCRYAKSGNCQLGKYSDQGGEYWLIPMLADDSKCPPECPPEGCF